MHPSRGLGSPGWSRPSRPSCHRRGSREAQALVQRVAGACSALLSSSSLGEPDPWPGSRWFKDHLLAACSSARTMPRVGHSVAACLLPQFPCSEPSQGRPPKKQTHEISSRVVKEVCALADKIVGCIAITVQPTTRESSVGCLPSPTTKSQMSNIIITPVGLFPTPSPPQPVGSLVCPQSSDVTLTRLTVHFFFWPARFGLRSLLPG